MTDNAKKKYVFVCGLHRSGTTVLARNIGQLENCTAFEQTGEIMDEGQFLQDVYPPDDDFGGVGLFAFDERAHLTETSPLLTPENAARLRESWHAHWDKNKNICIEKTPGNIIMGRFLQRIFEDCYFVVLKRHPIAVSLATQKWSRTPMHRLFDHWLRCHEIYEEDKRHLKNLYELRYEDYIENPALHLEKIAAFIGTRVSERKTEKITDAHNKKYFDRWAGMLRHSPMKSYYRFVAAKYQPKFGPHGYSLLEGLQDVPLDSETSGAMQYFAADAQARWWRFRDACKGVAKTLRPASTSKERVMRPKSAQT